MGNTIEAVSAVSEKTPVRPTAGDVGAPAVAAAPAPQNRPQDLRLVIEPTEAGDGYVYKTLDRRTGEVVNQYPREELVRMRDQRDYQAGAVVNARI